MEQSQVTRPKSSLFGNRWFARFVELILVPILLVYSLWLPPASIGVRLFGNAYPVVTAKEGGTITGPNGAVLRVLPGAVERQTRLGIEALDVDGNAGLVLPRPDLFVNAAGMQAIQLDPSDPEAAAIPKIPGDLVVYAPFYRLALRGDPPSEADVILPIPYELAAVERADLYAWDGKEWRWVSSTETSDGLSLQAHVGPLPSLLMVAQPYPEGLRIGLGVDPQAVREIPRNTEATVIYVMGPTMDGSPQLVGNVPGASEIRGADQAQRFLSISNIIDGVVRSDLLDNLVINEQGRREHIEYITALVEGGGYAGVELVYFGLDRALRAEFEALVRDLAAMLHEVDRLLAVRVEFPVRVVDGWDTGGYDWQTLGEIADVLRIQSAVDPAAYSSTDDDMDALLGWATDIVDRRKIDLVLTANSHDYVDGRLIEIPYADAVSRLAYGLKTDPPSTLLLPGDALGISVPNAGAGAVRLDEDAQVYWFEYQDANGQKHSVWLENGPSLMRKLQYASRYGLGGVGIDQALRPDNPLDVVSLLQAFTDARVDAVPSVNADYVLVCTVQDAAGEQVARQVMQLGYPYWTWTAPNNPGNYVIRAALSDDGGQTDLRPIAEVDIEVPTPTFTPLPTPTFTPVPPTPTPTNTPKPTPKPQPKPAAAGGSAPGYFGYGIQAAMVADGDHRRIFDHVKTLGFGWVKQQVEWFRYNPGPGQYDWGPLDRIVESANAYGINVLFSVVKAPGWARPPGDTDQGPPADPNTYGTFLREMAARYKGRVKAYEIWNEQNLYYEWGGRGGKINAARYVELLKVAYNAIKSVDPNAVVISGALTPTGVNDGDIAVDDRLYLEQMYQAGLARYCDAIGAHPSGYNNPPDADWRSYNDPSAPNFKGHPSFFFRGTMESYRNIMVKYGDGHKRIWPTEFGWASVDGLGVPPAPGYGYAADNSEAEQAQFIVRAYQMGKAWGWVGPMFLWNLNFAPVAGKQDEKAAFGIVRHDWSPRPAFAALRDMPK